MGWQSLQASLSRWDGGKPSGELEAAVQEVLSNGDDEEALKLFSEALNPSLQRGTDFLQRLSKTEGAKCRCDAVWYGDTIAYGCKTCGLSSASCICVACFDAGDHEGHDFYISRSDYGCCDCGDAYAWRRSGFCRHHPGSRREVDPAQLLPEVTRQRAHVFIPAQVRRLVRFQPSTFPEAAASSEGAGDSASSATGSGTDGRFSPGSGPASTDCREVATTAAATAAAEAGGQDGLPDEPSTPSGDANGPFRVLVTGVNLRVSEEQLRDFLRDRCANRAATAAGGAAGAGVRAGVGAVEAAQSLSVELVRDAENKASKGRAFVTIQNHLSLKALLRLRGEILRGSPLRFHSGAEAIQAAERHLQAWEAHYEWLLSLGGFHDGLRKIIGDVFLDLALLGDRSAVEVLLRHSHLMEPSVRKLETNLMVDLMLDLDFKHRFAQVFTSLYRELVLARAGNQDTNELGDFTCQIFTRQDVTLELVREHDLVRNLLSCLWDLLRPALIPGVNPAIFNYESTIFRDHEIIQCSMDLLYVLDHADVAREIVRTPRLRGELWEGWVRVLAAMQAMNPHERRTTTHVEFTSASWGNALTLHTDLMSNTWLILDAVESKASLDAVQDMARWTWEKLRSWLLSVRAAEGRGPADQLEEELIDFDVSKRAVSFHVPVNRVLALLLHHLCVRSASEQPEPASEAPRQSPSLHALFKAVGLAAEADVLWWMEHPLRTLVLHSQVSAGMWRRNGEALENESEFYRMNYWHHLLVDMDLLVLRMAALILRPETLFRTLFRRFELGQWLKPGDPLSWLAAGVPLNDEFVPQKLQSFILLVYQLLSTNTPLSLTFRQLVVHTTRQYLSIGPKSHSQLWDPRLERATATATAKDQQMLQNALREISNFSEADGTGHGSAKYRLNDDQWTAVDPYFHLFSWSEQQKSEENIATALKSRSETFVKWIDETVKLRPQPFEIYRTDFYTFSTCALVQAVCWLLLAKLAFKHLKETGAVADGRLLVLTLHLALRSAQAPCGDDGVGGNVDRGDSSGSGDMLDESSGECRDGGIDGSPAAYLCEDEGVQLFVLAAAMGPHLCVSARRRIRVRTAAFFDRQLCAEHSGAPLDTDVSLLDAVEHLCRFPEETVPGGLARGLRATLLQDLRNRRAMASRAPPWYAPPPPPTVATGAQLVGGADVDGGQSLGGGSCSSPTAPVAGGSGEADGTGTASQEEARRAKRRKAAQERQQRMLDDLKKRQAAFITGAQGQRMLEEATAVASKPGADGAEAAAECVVCISRQEDEDGGNPIGMLCFLRTSSASCLPRPRVPPESAVILQQPAKVPGAADQGARELRCFSPQAPDGLVLARSCSHRMHYMCWRRFRPAAIASNGGRYSCPYCGTVANALLPVTPPNEGPSLVAVPSYSARADPTSFEPADVPLQPIPRRHADASDDFLVQLGVQTRKLGAAHCMHPDFARVFHLEAEASLPVFAKLCADNVALAEVRLRARAPSGGSGGASASSSSASGGGDGRGAQGATAQAMLRCCAAEALDGAPSHTAVLATELAMKEVLAGTFATALYEATPHGRFQLFTALLIALCAGRGHIEDVGAQAAWRLLHGFYLLEIVLALGALASEELVASELSAAEAFLNATGSAGGGAPSAAAVIWRRVAEDAALCGPLGAGRLTPLRTREEALHVLRLALNPFLAKVHILLALLVPGRSSPLDRAAHLGALTPADEHRLLACAEFGLPAVEELLAVHEEAGAEAGTSASAAQSAALGSAAAHALSQWIGPSPKRQPQRGLQPPSPLLLVVVTDADASLAAGPVGPHGASSVLTVSAEEQPPQHVWQVSLEGFERLMAANRMEVAELSQGLPGVGPGRFFCVGYRLTLPVVTGRVYQKFYTRFVHARCTVCRTSPMIPTLCLLCGTFLCCNSECCRQRGDGEDGGQTLGEVTVHAQACGFGTCVFLQLSNSLVHIVADGFIASWGSLYLDEHGEEEYNLARPLHISEARLQQLTQSIREVSFDFESRLKWKKVIFV